MSRRKARDVAFKVVFQVDQVEADADAAFRYLVEEYKLDGEDRFFSWQLVKGCLDNITKIDEKLSYYSTAWDLHRMSSVDRNIMRVAAFEIMFMEGSQPVVAVDEGIELAKRYGDQGSPAFVNAILDKIMGENS